MTGVPYNLRRSVTVSTDGASITIQDLTDPVLIIAPPSPSVVIISGMGTVTIDSNSVEP